MSYNWITPEWDAPPNVRALMTTRNGGVSKGVYASMSLGDHVGDDFTHVARNRAILCGYLPGEPVWLKQVHGTAVIDAAAGQSGAEADASVSRSVGAVCAVMTADCLPLLLCDAAGSVVAAAHAGWRGLAEGVIERTVAAMQVDPATVMAYLGAAIGPQAFEVGAEVRAAFVAQDAAAQQAFTPHSEGKWLADIYLLARQRLARLGVEKICGGEYCTFTETERFYSYRRDGATGRMASLVWLHA